MAAPTSEDLDPPTTRARRAKLVDALKEKRVLTDPRVIEAFLQVPRHLFVPAPLGSRAYGDHPVPIGFEQTISQPTIVAMMTEALKLTGDERVLEVGTGSGYQAAILSLLAREVFSVERLASLARTAREQLDQLCCDNVYTRVTDGYRGWAEEAPFDRIILTAAPPEIPDALLAQLAEGGMVVAPFGREGEQRLVRGVRRAGVIHYDDLGGVTFVPMVASADAVLWN